MTSSSVACRSRVRPHVRDLRAPGTAQNTQQHYADGEKRYILCPTGVKQGDRVENGPTTDNKPGNCLPLRNVPTGTVVHAIELWFGGGAKLARSAGSGAQLLAKEGKYATLRMS